MAGSTTTKQSTWPYDKSASSVGELNLLDRRTGESRLIATLPDGTSCCTGALSVLADARLAVTQFIVNEGSQSVWSQPATVDLDTGETTHILQKGDLVVSTFAD